MVKSYRNFAKGYGKVAQKDAQDVKTAIMAILGVTTRNAFHQYLRYPRLIGDLQAYAIERVFEEHGIGRDEVWGDAPRQPRKCSVLFKKSGDVILKENETGEEHPFPGIAPCINYIRENNLDVEFGDIYSELDTGAGEEPVRIDE